MLSLLSVALRHPNAVVLYVALTRPSAKAILWRELVRVEDRLKLGLRFRETELEAVLPNGSTIALRGANKTDELEKFRGAHCPAIAIDEAASFRPSLLQTLIEDVLEPALMDSDGTLYLCGTPGAACSGYFHGATTGELPGWEVFHWTVLDNLAIPHARDWLERKKRQKGWSDDNPTLRREYLGEWVRDEDSLVYKFRRERNLVSAIPSMRSPARILSHDYGFNDSTAWCLLEYEAGRQKRADPDRATYVRRSMARPGLLASQTAAITQAWRDEWDPHTLIGDSGGFGKGYVEEWNSRFPDAAMVAAEKQNKAAYQELLNDALRCGRLQLLSGENEQLVEELETLQWVEKRRGNVVLREPVGDDHLCDALLYGWRESTAHLNRAQPIKSLDPDDPDFDEEIRRESRWQTRKSDRPWWARSTGRL